MFDVLQFAVLPRLDRMFQSHSMQRAATVLRTLITAVIEVLDGNSNYSSSPFRH